MTRRILAFVLAAVMLLSAVPVHAANPEPTFVVDTVTAAAGETVEVTIRLENNPGVTSIKLSMEHDSVLTLTAVSHNPDIGDDFLASPEDKYPVILNWYDGLKDVAGDWVFVTLTFAVAEDAEEGTYPISITYDPNDVYDANEDNVHFAVQNGGVTVEAVQEHKHSYSGGVCTGCGHSVLGTDWLAPDLFTGDYTVAVLPDTQNIVELAPDTYYKLTDWVANNQEALNIHAVIHLGDMVNTNTAAQWEIAKKGMDAIDASGVAWMPMRGNHDDSAMFNTYFDYSTYGSGKSWFGGSYDNGKLDHTYWYFTAAGRDYLVLSLGWAPSWDVLDWAEDIIEDNEDKNVIVSCHAYMDSDGYPLDYGDAGSVTSYAGLEDYPEGADVWEAISQHENVVLAMGGHVSSNNLVVYKGTNCEGKPIASILADAQTMDLSHPLGMVMLLTFHNGSDTVNINWYSAEYDAIYREENQFSVNVPHIHVHAFTPQVVAPTCQELGYTLYTCACGNSYQQDFVDALGHSEVIDEAVEATCTETGLTEGKHCSVCGEILVAQQIVPAKDHSYTSVVTAPTCTERGYTTHTCTCGESFVDSYVDALEHSFTNYTSNGDAGCTVDGTKTAKCDRCDATDTVTDAGSATGHSMGKWYETKAPTCTDKGTEQSDCANCEYYETRETEAKGHSYTDVVTAPTCTEQGYTTHTCACGDSYVDTYTTALGHDYGEWYQTKAPTLEAEGEERRDCSRCDEYQTRKLPMLVHSYTSVITEPTCTEQGYTTHTCTNCGDVYVDTYVDALGHSFTKYTSNGDSTCTEDGTKTAKCDRCDATDTVTDVGSKTGHSMGDWYETKAPTCTEKGTEQRDCADCEYFETRDTDAKGHSYMDVVTAPTCTERGYTTHTCACGDSYVDSYVSAKGHAMGEWYETKAPTCTEKGTEQRDCADCDHYETRETDAKGHSYTDVVTAPTCTEKGYTTHTCACGDSYVDSYVSAKGHAMGEWYETKAPTCTEKGTEQRDCADCEYFETRETDAKGHSYTDVVTAPTCTEKGYTTHTCACGDSYVDSYVSAKGHAMGEWYETKAPTCTEKGTEQRDCADCEYFETRETDAKGHSYTDAVTAATCTEQGYTTHTCGCGDSYVDTYTAALGHDYGEWYQTKAPTLEAEGEERRDCSRCDEYQTRKLPMLVHSYTSVVTAPTCTEQGYTTHTCANCGDVYVDSFVNALGHSFTNYTSNGDATCTEDGTKTATCDRCDATDTVTDVGSANGHAMGEWYETKAPTCIDKGAEQRNCANCDHLETREVAAKGHSYTEKVTAPTCTEQGYTTHSCACGDSYVDSYVAALGHSWDDGVVTKEPTEKEEGVRTYTCGTCSETKTESIPILEHTHKFSQKVTLPTCTEEGYTTFLCACGESYVSQRVEALGHDVVVIEGKKATCTENGLTEGSYCGRCEEVLVKQETVPATGHNWGQWVETMKPNATTDGVNTRTCIVCDETETEIVDNNIFSDVKKDRFENAILWAYYEGITTGTGDGTTFSPEDACTRKQIVTFLWRAAGEPEPKSMVNPFVDVKHDRFEKAILWAYYEGITNGTGDGSTFSPENTCTRKQIVTFLWRFYDEPAPKSMENKFVDVKNDRFTAAILWAAEQGITTGTGDGSTFSPEDPCTRKQIVTFLYRYLTQLKPMEE